MPDDDVTKNPRPIHHFNSETEGNQAERFLGQSGSRPRGLIISCPEFWISDGSSPPKVIRCD